MTRRLLYLVFVLLFIAFLLEVGLRIAGTYNTYSEKMGQGYRTYYNEVHPSYYWTYSPLDTFLLDHSEFQYQYITNSLGLREHEINWGDSTDIRLAVFGDSFTEGVGADYDNTWPREMERRLKNEGFNTSVFNAGASGSDPFFSFQMLKDKILPANPSHVIFCSNSNDLEDVLFRSGFDRFRNDGSAVSKDAPGFHRWYKHFHLMRFYFESIRGYDKTLIRKKELRSQQVNSIALIKSCLDSAYALCRAEDVKFLFVTHIPPRLLCGPFSDELDLHYYADYEYAYPNIFLENQFREEIPTESCYDYQWEIDGHFNAKGYTLMGRLLFDEINEHYPGFWKEENDKPQ